jgi:4-hydroxy-tetrahydrodipicolinate synthase
MMAAASAQKVRAQSNKRLRGIFPIMHTPFTDDGKLDIETLVNEVLFLDKVGAHGMVWPQMASEWWTLTPAERHAGAGALAKASVSLRPALVLGVQGSDKDSAVEYARHAETLLPDAIIALAPPAISTADAQFEYFKAIGKVCSRPLFVQSTGQMPVDLIIEMSRAIPTLRFIKDEAGYPLPRVSEFRRKAPWLHSFTGNHGRTLFDEMMRGAAGSMPASSFVELYVQGWDLFQAGRKAKSAEMCARATLMVPIAEAYGIRSLKYMLVVRGIFKNDLARSTANDKGPPLDEEGRASIRELLAALKPWLRA